MVPYCTEWYSTGCCNSVIFWNISVKSQSGLFRNILYYSAFERSWNSYFCCLRVTSGFSKCWFPWNVSFCIKFEPGISSRVSFEIAHPYLDADPSIHNPKTRHAVVIMLCYSWVIIDSNLQQIVIHINEKWTKERWLNKIQFTFKVNQYLIN